MATIGKNLKTIWIPSIHGQANLVVSKSMILCVRYSEFPKIIKTISVFWSLIFQNPVLGLLQDDIACIPWSKSTGSERKKKLFLHETLIHMIHSFMYNVHLIC